MFIAISIYIFVMIFLLLIFMGMLVLIARYANLFPVFSTLFGVGIISCSIYLVILLAIDNDSGGFGVAIGEVIASFLAVILFILGAFFIGGAFNAFKDYFGQPIDLQN